MSPAAEATGLRGMSPGYPGENGGEVFGMAHHLPSVRGFAARTTGRGIGAPAPEGGCEAGADRCGGVPTRRIGLGIGDGLRVLRVEVNTGANRGPSHPLRHAGSRAPAFGFGSQPVSGPPGNTSARIGRPRREAAAVGVRQEGATARGGVEMSSDRSDRFDVHQTVMQVVCTWSGATEGGARLVGIKEPELQAMDAGLIATQFISGIRTPRFDGEMWTVEVYEERGGEVMIIARYVLTPSAFIKAAMALAPIADAVGTGSSPRMALNA